VRLTGRERWSARRTILTFFSCLEETGHAVPYPRPPRPRLKRRAPHLTTSAIVQVFRRRNGETFPAFRWPASKKRQGTKSREVGHRLASGCYGDLNFPPVPMVCAMATQRERNGCARVVWESGSGLLVGARSATTNGQRIAGRSRGDGDRRQRAASSVKRENRNADRRSGS
jgi:hypothetical protein